MRVLVKFGIVCMISLIMNSCQSKEHLFQEKRKDWVVKGAADWSFGNAVLTGMVKDTSGFIVTNKTYKDFQLELEFKPDSTINSGVFIRCNGENVGAKDCYEINIWDLHPNQDYRTGAIVTRMKPLKKVHTLNRWNRYKIRSQAEHIQVWINDTLTADFKDKSLPQGYIALQAAGVGTIKFRKLTLVSLH